MNRNRHDRQRLGVPILFLGTVLAGVGLFPTLAAAEGGAPGPNGRLTVEKRVDGEGPDQFSFHVVCTDDSGTVLDRTFDLVMDGGIGSRDFDAVPTGAECTVTETDGGGADSTVVTPRDGSVVVGDDDPVTVSFVNIFVPPPTTTTTTAPAPTTTTTAPAAVLGAVLTAPAPAATLPVTGRSELSLILAGSALVILGAALRLRTRKARA